MGTERSAAEEKCLRDLFDRLDFDFQWNDEPKQNSGKEEGKKPRKKRATDGAQQNPRLNEKLQNSETVNIARSLAVQPDSWGFLSDFPQKVIKLAEISQRSRLSMQFGLVRLARVQPRVWECAAVKPERIWKREERVKREFNTQNLKIIGFRCADCNPRKSLLVSGLQSKPNIWRRNKWKRKTRLTVGLARKIN